MGTLADALAEFRKQKKWPSWRNSDGWKAVELKFENLSLQFGSAATREELDRSREEFSRACEEYLKSHSKGGDPLRVEAVRGLWKQVEDLTEKDLQAGADGRVSLADYAADTEKYREAYQTKLIDYRSAGADRMKARLGSMQGLLPGVDLNAVTGYVPDRDSAINETSARAEVKKLEAYRKTCRQIVEVGIQSRNPEMEIYGRRLLQSVQDSPLDNLRDLKLVREMEKGSKTFGDTDAYKTPEIRVTLQSGDAVGVGSSVRYNNVTVGDTKGFLTPFSELHFDSVSNRIGEIIQSQELSRESIRVLNWLRDNRKMEIRDDLESAVQSPAARKQFGDEVIGRVHKELDEKSILTKWLRDESKEGAFMQYMGEGGPVYESGFMEKRNIAMSRMAELLGAGDVLARSRTVVYEENGRKRQGCFMDTAEGMQLSSMEQKAEGMLKETKGTTIRPEAWKKIEKLMILDTICGQTDRHNGNYFVQFRKGEDGNLEVLGVQGIDNDLAFANRAYSKTWEDRGMILDNNRWYSAVPGAGDGNSLFIDETTAGKIRSLTEEDIRYAVGDCLPEKDIQALWTRTQMVRDLMDPEKSGKNRILVLRDDEQDWEFSRDEKGQPTHRLAAPDAPDREVFCRNAEMLLGQSEANNGPHLLRIAEMIDRTRSDVNKKEEVREKETKEPEVAVREQEAKKPEAAAPVRQKISLEQLAQAEHSVGQKKNWKRAEATAAAGERQREAGQKRPTLGSSRTR